MLENPVTISSSGIQKGLREISRLPIALEVALHDDISGSRHERCPNDVQITVTECIHTDTGDEIVFDGSIGEFDQRTSPETRSHQGKDQPASTRFSEGFYERLCLGLSFGQWRSDTVDRLLRLSDAVDYLIDGTVDFRGIDRRMQG